MTNSLIPDRRAAALQAQDRRAASLQAQAYAASNQAPIQAEDLAVFSRNHAHYLKEASRLKRDQRVTFRSKVRWVSVAAAVNRSGAPRQIYFCEIDRGSQVRYQADLVQVQVDPSRKSAVTIALLKHVLKSTKPEKLWDDSVQTLYVISNCRKLKKPFPQTRLRRQDSNRPLSKDYIRSYALVHELV